jgi:nucleotide-binding universal stress UspA family protein
MTQITRPRITVGVFDAPEADAAIRWAAHHAARVGGSLHLVHAFVWTELDVNTDPIPGLSGSGIRAAATSLLEDALAIARHEEPGLEITSDIIDGPAVPVLVEASRSSDLMVVGGRGHGRLLTLVVGSKSLALSARSFCPVVVVRGEITAEGPIGLVHNESATEHVHRAGELALAYQSDIVLVVRATSTPDQAQAALADVREQLATSHPAAYVRDVKVAASTSARELVHASEGTSMMVVAGDRASGPDARVSAPRQLVTVLQYANTPVWIERD